MSRAHNWLVLGHYGGHNTGDEAMLLGLVKGYQSIGEESLFIVTKDGELPANLALLQGHRSVDTQIYQILTLLPQVKGIILGGGTHFHDDYTGLRCIRHYRYLIRFIGIFFLARILRKKVILLSMGFGPFHHLATKWLTRVGLSLSTHITVRETLSYQEIINWVPKDKVTLSFDLAALSIPKTTKGSIPKGDILGISVLSMKNLKPNGEELDNIFWSRMITALSRVLKHNSTLRIRIFVIRGGMRESDVGISTELFQKLNHEYGNRVEMIPYDPDPNNTLEKIAECKAFIATRFHAAVLSYLTECRLLLLTYHRKIEDLAKEICLSEQACIPIDIEISSEFIYNKIIELLSDNSNYLPKLKIDEAIQRAKLNMQVWRRYS